MRAVVSRLREDEPVDLAKALNALRESIATPALHIDLERVAVQNRDLRASQVARAEEIVEQELKAFLLASRERTAVPVLARLRAHAESVARAEVEKTLASLQGLDEKQQKTVRAMASAIVNKLLHRPTARLREEAGQGPLGEAAAELFGLDDEPGGPQPVPMPVPDPAPDPAPAPLPEPDPEPASAVLPMTRNG